MGYDRRAAAGLQYLAFEGEEFGGFEVWLRQGTVDALSLLTSLGGFASVTGLTMQNITALTPLAREIAGLIVRWNLEENGQPVPVSAAYFLGLDALFVLQVTMVYARLAVGLPQSDAAPVEDELPDAELALASLPMLDVAPLGEAV